MIYVIRTIFLILVSLVAVAYLFATLSNPTTGSETMPAKEAPVNFAPYLIMLGGVVLAFGLIVLDVLTKKKNLSALSGLLFGVLVGVLISLCLGYLIDQIAETFLYRVETTDTQRLTTLIQGMKLLVGLIITYVTTTFVLQTRDDFRFIIPYVEFKRATKGPRPIILDTSVIIDGRIADVASTGMFETTLLVPRFVLNELQTIADSADRLKRSRGRRGLDVLEKLKGLPRLELRFWDGTLNQNIPDPDGGTERIDLPPAEGVDQKLVVLALQENARIMTNDYNLNKVATLRGITVINVNQIAEALKPVILPGETMKVRIIKPGENPGQGVGYLEDGTMVVIEGARDKVGAEVEVVVTNMIQNAAGKMIFGRAVPPKALQAVQKEMADSPQL